MPRLTPLPPELGHRPFTVAEAQALGMSEQRLRHRGLSRPAYSVRQAGADPRGTDLARLAEATDLVLPVGSAFSHLTAAPLLGLPLPRRWAPAELLDVMNVTAAAKTRRAGCSGQEAPGRSAAAAEAPQQLADGDPGPTAENLQDDGWAFTQLIYASVMLYPRNQATVRRLRRLLGLDQVLDP